MTDAQDWKKGLDLSVLSRMTLKDSAEALVRNALLNGVMEPGRIYSANSIAAQLGTSNSPVREAMMSLANKGLLILERNRGFRVVELSEQDKREVYELRLLIEVEAVRRAAQQQISKGDQTRLRELAAQTVQLVTADDMARYLEVDQEFHSTLVGLTGNRRWCEMVETLRDQSRINGAYHYIRGNNLLARSAQEHVEIAQAAIEGDAALAGDLMARHVEYARPQGG